MHKDMGRILNILTLWLTKQLDKITEQCIPLKEGLGTMWLDCLWGGCQCRDIKAHVFLNAHVVMSNGSTHWTAPVSWTGPGSTYKDLYPLNRFTCRAYWKKWNLRKQEIELQRARWSCLAIFRGIASLDRTQDLDFVFFLSACI